jgi:hypothetical protein
MQFRPLRKLIARPSEELAASLDLSASDHEHPRNICRARPLGLAVAIRNREWGTFDANAWPGYSRLSINCRVRNAAANDWYGGGRGCRRSRGWSCGRSGRRGRRSGCNCSPRISPGLSRASACRTAVLMRGPPRQGVDDPPGWPDLPGASTSFGRRRSSPPIGLGWPSLSSCCCSPSSLPS